MGIKSYTFSDAGTPSRLQTPAFTTDNFPVSGIDGYNVLPEFNGDGYSYVDNYPTGPLIVYGAAVNTFNKQSASGDISITVEFDKNAGEPTLGWPTNNLIIFARLNESSPNIDDDCIYLQYVHATGDTSAASWDLIVMIGGSEIVNTGGTMSVNDSSANGIHKITMTVSGNTVSARYYFPFDEDYEICNETNAAISTMTGGAWGWGQRVGPHTNRASYVTAVTATNLYNPDSVAYVDSFEIQFSPITRAVKNAVVAIAGGNIYMEDALGEMAGTTGSYLELADGTPILLADGTPLLSAGGIGLITPDKQIDMTEFQQKLYIADYDDPRVEGTDGIIDGANLRANSVSDWTALGITSTSDVVVLTTATGSSVATGIYAIDSITQGFGDRYLTLGDAPGDGACTFAVVPAPKIFDPVTLSLSRWEATAGTVPANCELICTYNGRIILGNDRDSPHMWYASRQGNPLDFDYSAIDAQGAMAGNNIDGGRIGKPLTALIPHSDDWLVMACANELWIMRGDAKAGGSIDNLSYHVGIMSKRAWCKDRGNNIYFMSANGLYFLPNAGEAQPTNVSIEKIPEELVNLDRALCEVIMGYDPRREWVVIEISYNDARSTVHWIYDTATQGFFRMTHSTDRDAFSMLTHISDIPGRTALLFGGRDGYIRKMSSEHDLDDNETFDSYVDLGPIRLGGSDYDVGNLAELIAAPSGDGNIANVKVYVANSPEALKDASYFSSHELVAGKNHTKRPRARGHSLLIRVSDSPLNRALLLADGTPILLADNTPLQLAEVENGDSKWSLESLLLTIIPAGAQRI